MIPDNFVFQPPVMEYSLPKAISEIVTPKAMYHQLGAQLKKLSGRRM